MTTTTTMTYVLSDDNFLSSGLSSLLRREQRTVVVLPCLLSESARILSELKPHDVLVIAVSCARLLKSVIKIIRMKRTGLCLIIDNKKYNISGGRSVGILSSTSPLESIIDDIDYVIRHNKLRRTLNDLSLTEVNVLRLLSAGCHANFIARLLNIKTDTVLNLKRTAKLKIGMEKVNNRFLLLFRDIEELRIPPVNICR